MPVHGPQVSRVEDLLANVRLEWNEDRPILHCTEEMRQEHLVLSQAEAKSVQEHHGARACCRGPITGNTQHIPKMELLSTSLDNA